MLGIIEIKRKTPKDINQTGGFLFIKFKIENKEDLDLLMDIFWEYMNSTFCGLSDEKTPEHIDMEVTINKEETIYYDYQAGSINII
jgi:hypothetical protein